MSTKLRQFWFATAVGISGILAAQEPPDPEIPDEPDPEVSDTVDRVDSAWKDRRMQRDGEVVAGLRKLAIRSEAPLHPDDRKSILTVATLVLTKGRLRDPESRHPYEAATEVLAKFDADGAKVLLQVYDRKIFPRKPDWEPMRAKLVQAIGETHSEGADEFLLNIATRSGEDRVLREAGKALGNWAGASEATRKEIVDKLAGRLAGFEGLAREVAVSQDGQLNLGAEAARKTVTEIRSDWCAALARLTGQSFATGVEWTDWYREHRRKPWPERRSSDGI
jgi:hypothetical protein